MLKNVAKYKGLLFMMLPGIIYLLINNYLPMFGIVIAFKNINFAKGIWGSDWVGLKNFEYLFKTSDAYIITRNTIGYNSLFIVLSTIFAIAIAILLNEIRVRFLSRLFQSLVLLPYLISMVIVGYLVLAFLNVENGFINKTVLPMLGMEGIPWYSETKYWPYILTIVNTWHQTGYLCVVYLAAIIGIDQEYYEAATLDGANRWQQVWKVTLPLISPIVTTMVLLAIGRIFYSDFGLFYQVPLNTGALMPVTNTIDTYVYRALMNLGDFGMSSAAGLYQAVVGLTLILISNTIVKKINRDNALF